MTKENGSSMDASGNFEPKPELSNIKARPLSPVFSRRVNQSEFSSVPQSGQFVIIMEVRGRVFDLDDLDDLDVKLRLG